MAKDASLSVSLTFPDEAREGFRLAFGPFKTKQQEEEATRQFALIAITALADWVTGQKRYRTLTEQYIDWIEQVYAALLPADEAPSAERIYNSLNMPYGQATYIARVLASKTLVQWRTLAVDELRTALKDREKDGRGYIKEGDQDQPINLQLSQVALYELNRVCSARKRADRSYMLPQVSGRSGDYRFVSIPAITLADLLDNPNW